MIGRIVAVPGGSSCRGVGSAGVGMSASRPKQPVQGGVAVVDGGPLVLGERDHRLHLLQVLLRERRQITRSFL